VTWKKKITGRNSTLQRNTTAKPRLGTRRRNASGDTSVLVFPAGDAAGALLPLTVLAPASLSPGRAVTSLRGARCHRSSPRAPVLDRSTRSGDCRGRDPSYSGGSGRCRWPRSSHRRGSSFGLGGPARRRGAPGASGAGAFCCAGLSIALPLAFPPSLPGPPPSPCPLAARPGLAPGCQRGAASATSPGQDRSLVSAPTPPAKRGALVAEG